MYVCQSCLLPIHLCMPFVIMCARVLFMEQCPHGPFWLWWVWELHIYHNQSVILLLTSHSDFTAWLLWQYGCHVTDHKSVECNCRFMIMFVCLFGFSRLHVPLSLCCLCAIHDQWVYDSGSSFKKVNYVWKLNSFVCARWYLCVCVCQYGYEWKFTI